jgi:enamine deaminase RidA (YjgF/YER057c/UK114 family)
MQKRDINATLAPKPASAYSQAIEVTGCTRILFIGGQVGNANVPFPVLLDSVFKVASCSSPVGSEMIEPHRFRP